MKTITKKITILSLAIVTLISFTSCEATKNANGKQKGAVIGAAGGALLGAVLGNNVGKGGKGEVGAVLGGVLGGAAGVLIGNKMDNQAKEIENEIPGAEVVRVDDGIIITFDEKSGVYFDTGKSNINADCQVTLDKLAGVLMEYPDTDVQVVGHTDSVGNDDSNLALSEKRAKSVTSYFTTVKNLSPSRFMTKWYGEQVPVGDNATPEGRASNRRVNVIIVPNEKMINDAEQEAGN